MSKKKEETTVVNVNVTHLIQALSVDIEVSSHLLDNDGHDRRLRRLLKGRVMQSLYDWLEMNGKEETFETDQLNAFVHEARDASRPQLRLIKAGNTYEIEEVNALASKTQGD